MKKKYLISGLLGIAAVAAAITFTTAATLNSTKEIATETYEDSKKENAWIDAVSDDEYGETSIKLLGSSGDDSGSEDDLDSNGDKENLTADKLLVQISAADDDGYRNIRYIGGLTSEKVTAKFIRTIYNSAGEELNTSSFDVKTAYEKLKVDDGDPQSASDLFGNDYKYIVIYTMKGVPADCIDYAINVTLSINDDEDTGGRNANVLGVDMIENPDNYVNDDTFTYKKTEDGSGYSIKVADGKTDETSYTIPACYYDVPDPNATSLVGKKCKIVEIGAKAFEDCKNLEHLTIIPALESSADDAFGVYDNFDSVSLGAVGTGDEDELSSYLSKILGSSADSVTNVEILDGCESIGDYAFCYLTSLESLTIPDTVTSIGEYAFFYCENLENLAIPDGVTSIGEYAFYNCESFTEIVLPDGITNVSYAMFDYCTGLTSITIPKGVTSIEGYSFSGCEALTSISIPSTVTGIEDAAFKGCSALESVIFKTDENEESSVTSIGDSAFAECSHLTSIDLPDQLTTIEDYLFSGSGLANIVIPSGVTTIDLQAFENCGSLESVTIPSSVSKIDSNAFSSCNNIKSLSIGCNLTEEFITTYFSNSPIEEVTLLNGYETIVAKAFYGCTSLKNITIPSTVTSIGDYAFGNCALTSVEIPNSVTSIGDYAFSNCGLTSVEIPNSVTSISDHAFEYCSALTNITIPSSVTSIGDCAFEYCSALTNVTIPSSVTSIGDCAFYECDSLEKITIPASVTSIGGLAFAYGATYIVITYSGTSESWKNITKGSDWINTDYEMVYSDNGDNNE